MRFKDKTVVVTGATGGIGSAVTRRFYNEGANIALLDLSQNALEAFVEKEGFETGRFLIIPIDLSKEEQVKEAINSIVNEFGTIDVLNNIAGVGGDQGPMEEKPLNEWYFVYGVNVFGTVSMIKYVLPIMKEQRSGVITNTGSVSGMFGYAGESAYGSSKWAVIGLTKNIANENGGNGIRVNSVSPGWVNTPMFQKALDDYIAEGYENPMENVTIGPMGRPSEPEEMANVFAFLASEDAAFINGANVLADGGMTLG